MASSHGTPPVFNNKVIAWIDHRLPVFSYIEKEYHTFPTPRNFNYFWNFGAIATVMLVLMIATGVVLATNYTPHVLMAFDSVERIDRDVPQGWLIRDLHMNGASFFFIAVYIHIFRGMYYGSYKAPRELLWILGVVIFLLMMATAFMGYVLPWGQMSFWGATVITNLFSAIPVVGESIVTWLWGGFAIDNPTLNRFYALHYLLPFIIVAVVALHVMALHVHGSNNPLGIDPKGPQDTVPFHPYYTMKDGFGVVVFLIVYAGFTFFAPDYLGHPDNYIPANPLVTPEHIVPEWYFLPFYAILRAMPDKLGGVLAMFGAIAVLFVLPWLDTSRVRSATFRPIYKWFMLVLVVDVIVLGFCGANPPAGFWIPLSPARHGLLFLPLPDPAADPGQDRTTVAIAAQHCRRRAQEEGGLIMRKLLVTGAIAAASLATAAVAIAAGNTPHPPHKHWHFQGPFGTYDRAAAQRGYQVYHEVCAACHSLSLLAYRNLMELGLTENQAKDLIKDIQVPDLNDDGQPIERPARLSDRFKKPFPNEAAAAAANNGKAPPDLSVIIKARENGPDYVHAPADRLRAVRQAHARAGQGVRRHQGRQLQQVLPGPQDRDGAAAHRRQGDLRRRHQGHDRPGSLRRRRVPGLGVRAAHGGPQAHRRSRHPVPARHGRADVRGEALGVVRQALTRGKH